MQLCSLQKYARKYGTEAFPMQSEQVRQGKRFEEDRTKTFVAFAFPFPFVSIHRRVCVPACSCIA